MNKFRIIGNKQLYTYYISFFLYNFARVLPHAILTVILLEKGMSIGNIAVIQSFYMIAGLLFEFPSGVLTDMWSEKMMYLLSLLLLAISYFIIMISYSFPILCLSWFIYGTSNAAISGSLETYFLRKFKNDENKVKEFNVGLNNSELYSGLIGGGIGSFVYTFLDNGLYIISIILVILSGLIIVFFFKDDGYSIAEDTSNSDYITIKSIFSDINNMKSKGVFIAIALMASYQIVLQLFFQFWQVMFLGVNISKESFGIFYVTFQILAIISNAFFKRINFNSVARKIFLIIMMSVFFGYSFFVTNKIIFVILIFLFLLPFNIYNNQLVVDIQKNAPTKIISSVMSLSGTISSIISMLFLWTVGILDRILPFRYVSILSITIFLILSSILVYREFQFNKKRKLYI